MALGVSAYGTSSHPINLSSAETSILFRQPNLLPKPNTIQRPNLNISSAFQLSRKRNFSTFKSFAFKQPSYQLKTAEKQRSPQANSPLTELRSLSYENNTATKSSPVVSNQQQQFTQKEENQNDSSPFKVPCGLPPKRNTKKATGSKVDVKVLQQTKKSKKSNSHINRVDVHHAKTSRRPKLTGTSTVFGSQQSTRRCPGYDMFLLPEPKNDTLFDVLFSINNDMDAVKRNFSVWLTGELQYLVPQSTYLKELHSVPENVLEWTVANVSSFINAIGFSEAAEYLEEHRVDGAGLLLLKQCDLMDVLGLQPLPAAHLFGFILRLHGDITQILGVNYSKDKQSSTNLSSQTKCISTHLKELKIDTSSSTLATEKIMANTSGSEI